MLDSHHGVPTMLRTRLLLVVAAALLAVSFAGQARATTYTFQPNPVDLYDLDHYSYYTWGINWSLPANEQMSSASLSFLNIANWDNNPNELWVHLLPSGTAGVTVSADSNNGTDAFAGQGTLLFEYTNLTTVPQTRTYNFVSSDLTALTSYAADGNFALAFDPDCHYYNDGITLTINTQPRSAGAGPVPEPTTAAMGGLALVGLAAAIRRRPAAR
jgi:hypothetical protein